MNKTIRASLEALAAEEEVSALPDIPIDGEDMPMADITEQGSILESMENELADFDDTVTTGDNVENIIAGSPELPEDAAVMAMEALRILNSRLGFESYSMEGIKDMASGAWEKIKAIFKTLADYMKAFWAKLSDFMGRLFNAGAWMSKAAKATVKKIRDHGITAEKTVKPSVDISPFFTKEDSPGAAANVVSQMEFIIENHTETLAKQHVFSEGITVFHEGLKKTFTALMGRDIKAAYWSSTREVDEKIEKSIDFFINSLGKFLGAPKRDAWMIAGEKDPALKTVKTFHGPFWKNEIIVTEHAVRAEGDSKANMGKMQVTLDPLPEDKQYKPSEDGYPVADQKSLISLAEKVGTMGEDMYKFAAVKNAMSKFSMLGNIMLSLVEQNVKSRAGSRDEGLRAIGNWLGHLRQLVSQTVIIVNTISRFLLTTSLLCGKAALSYCDACCAKKKTSTPLSGESPDADSTHKATVDGEVVGRKD